MLRMVDSDHEAMMTRQDMMLLKRDYWVCYGPDGRPRLRGMGGKKYLWVFADFSLASEVSALGDSRVASLRQANNTDLRALFYGLSDQMTGEPVSGVELDTPVRYAMGEAGVMCESESQYHLFTRDDFELLR